MSVINGKLYLQKQSSNKLNDTILNKHVKEISEATKNRAAAAGVSCVAEPLVSCQENGGYTYSFVLNIGRPIQRSESRAVKQIEEAKKFIVRAAEMRGWTYRDGQDVEQAKAVAVDRPEFKVGELTDEVFSKYFNGIYEREPHIRVIHDSVKNAIDTNFTERDHIVLFGPPAVCKSTLIKRFKKFYEDGSDIERIAILNSTTLSKAGIETWILEKAKDKILPEILFFDEIEKFSLDNLNCLLSLMEENGTISRTNARIGRQSAEAKTLVFASCNDEQKLKDFASGALWSRFTKRLGCGRPRRDLMRQILIASLQERQANGEKVNLAWADAAINYAFDKMKINDPREIKSLLAGRDRLLTGEYFADLEKINQDYHRSMTNEAGR